MQIAALDVLAHGLPELSTELSYSMPIPLAFWKGETFAAVLFLFYSKARYGGFEPGVTIQVGVGSHAWPSNNWRSPSSTLRSCLRKVEA